MDIYNLISGRRLPSDGEKDGARPGPTDEKEDDVFLVEFEPGDGLNPRLSSVMSSTRPSVPADD